MSDTIRAFRLEITLLSLLVPVSAIAAVAVALWRRSRGADIRSAAYTTLVDLGLLFWIIATLLITLLNTQGGVREPPDLVPLRAIWRAAQEPTDSTFIVMVLNVGLFLPFGMLAPLKWPHWGRIWPITWRAGLVSLAVETLQFLINPRRTASINDVLLNALGAAVGLLLAMILRRVLEASPRGPYHDSRQPP